MLLEEPGAREAGVHVSRQKAQPVFDNPGKRPGQSMDSRLVRRGRLLGLTLAVFVLVSAPAVSPLARGSEQGTNTFSLYEVLETGVRNVWSGGERFIANMRQLYQIQHLNELAIQPIQPAAARAQSSPDLSLCHRKPAETVPSGSTTASRTRS